MVYGIVIGGSRGLWKHTTKSISVPESHFGFVVNFRISGLDLARNTKFHFVTYWILEVRFLVYVC